MADSYLIDGYNLIHALGMIQRDLPAGGLEESRRRLMMFLLQAFAADVSVTIVFDAQHGPRHLPRQQTHQGLHVEFAPAGQSADDRIEELIEDCASPSALVVVSNDMRLQDAARRKGSRGWSHENLLDFLDKRRSRRQRNRGQTLAGKERRTIGSRNRELDARIWTFADRSGVERILRPGSVRIIPANRCTLMAGPGFTSS